jgi:hypothetical protein
VDVFSTWKNESSSSHVSIFQVSIRFTTQHDRYAVVTIMSFVEFRCILRVVCVIFDFGDQQVSKKKSGTYIKIELT